ncbi:substrate-binding domain-containing protein [Verrucomicrobiota bacterium sgz303538]
MRSSLVQDTARVLRAWIQAGRLKGHLPGERQLAQSLHVSRETVRGACALLEAEGLFSSVGDRRSRVILRTASVSQAETLDFPVRVLLREPPERQPPSTLFWIDDLRVQLAAQSRSLHIHAPQVFSLDQPGRRLDELTHQSPAAAWILYAASEPMLRWFHRSRLPTLVLGSVPPELSLPAVAVDFRAVGYHAGLRFVRAGHRHIAVLRPRGTLAGLRELERGLHAALDGTDARLSMWKEDRTPASIADTLAAGLRRRNRPTALLLTRGEQVMTVFSWLAREGMRCPRELSLAAAVSDTWFNNLVPPIDYYLVDPRQYALLIGRTLNEVLSGSDLRGVIRRIVPTHMPGETVVPPCLSA